MFEINEVNSGLGVDSSQGVQAISDTSERLRVRRSLKRKTLAGVAASGSNIYKPRGFI